jgi:peptide/nickel transport system substrate-binding protein
MVENITNKSITLRAFEDYWEVVNITRYRYVFYEDYFTLNSAIKNNEIDIVNIYDLNNIENLEYYPFYEVNEAVLYNRKKMIYFNTRREKFSDKSLRQAISYLINKEYLMDQARVYGEIARSPISPQSWAFNDSIEYYSYNPEKAREILESLNYVRESEEDYYITVEDSKVLSLELSYFKNDLNERLAESMVTSLEDEGILLRLRPLTFDQMSREVLPTRDFELLLYEVEVTVDPDQYNLWHSLRIDHPMLNISGYDYSRIDILLERARTNVDRDSRTDDYRLFQRYLIEDAPVILLYHPKVFVVSRKGLNGIDIQNIVYPSDKYVNVQNWYWEI